MRGYLPLLCFFAICWLPSLNWRVSNLLVKMLKYPIKVTSFLLGVKPQRWGRWTTFVTLMWWLPQLPAAMNPDPEATESPTPLLPATVAVIMFFGLQIMIGFLSMLNLKRIPKDGITLSEVLPQAYIGLSKWRVDSFVFIAIVMGFGEGAYLPFVPLVLIGPASLFCMDAEPTGPGLPQRIRSFISSRRSAPALVPSPISS